MCHGLSLFNVLDMEIVLIYTFSFKGLMYSSFVYFLIYFSRNPCSLRNIFVLFFVLIWSFMVNLKVKGEFTKRTPYCPVCLGDIFLHKINASLRSELDDRCKR